MDLGCVRWLWWMDPVVPVFFTRRQSSGVVVAVAVVGVVCFVVAIVTVVLRQLIALCQKYTTQSWPGLQTVGET